MVLRLDDQWVWDFWFAKDGEDYHIFYLQADKSLGNPEFRHFNPSIGHAKSNDLTNWEILPDAIAPTTDRSAWDDNTTWTGSIIKHNDRWYMFYTGGRRREHALVQRVGLATSDDLITWQKYGDTALFEADPQWYEKLSLDLWHDEAWRDPWVFKHPKTGIFHAYTTARVNYGDADGRGVIGHATSSDLLTWEVKPPITDPGEFGQMEVPQLEKINGRYYLLFSTNREHHSATRNQRTNHKATTGTHYLVSDSPMGPFTYLTDDFMVSDEAGTLYSGKLIQAPDNTWCFMAFLNNHPENESFIGEISDPMSVKIAEDGRLLVETR